MRKLRLRGANACLLVMRALHAACLADSNSVTAQWPAGPVLWLPQESLSVQPQGTSNRRLEEDPSAGGPSRGGVGRPERVPAGQSWSSVPGRVTEASCAPFGGSCEDFSRRCTPNPQHSFPSPSPGLLQMDVQGTPRRRNSRDMKNRLLVDDWGYSGPAGLLRTLNMRPSLFNGGFKAWEVPGKSSGVSGGA